MAKPIDNDKPKIQMLLDIENIFGESTRGLGKFVLTLIAIAALPLLILYTSAFLFIPWQILVIACIIWAIWMILLILGEQGRRLANYKRLRDDAFSLTDDMVRIKTIHPNGCIEYVNGAVAFFVVMYNNSSVDVVRKSQQFDRFINIAVGKHPFDIYVQNLTDTDELDGKYANVTLFSDDEAAEAFMEIIDFNREKVSSSSTLTRNILCVRGTKYQWKDIYGDLMSAVSSESSRVFRQCYIATDREQIEAIISRDIDGHIDLEGLMQKKYYTGNKRNSKIISYDYKDLKPVEKEQEKQEDEVISFIPKL